MIVIDASVAVKWFFQEPQSGAADALLKGPDRLVAPQLISTEVAAAIVRKGRLGEINADDALDALDLWQQATADGTVLMAQDETDLRRAAEIALEIDHPLQDCLYLALALRLELTLVTADRKFAKRAGEEFQPIRALT